MKFIDDLYHLYRDHLTGDDEDAVAIVLGILQELNREDLMKLVSEMDENEIYTMVGYFLVELLRRKMAEEGVGNTKGPINEISSRLH